MKMSSDNHTLHRLLDSSCEDMLLYFQELVSHLERDVAATSAELNLLFADKAIALDDEDEHQDGKVLSEEEALAKKKKLEKFKELAGKNENYKKFSAKYGKGAAKTLLGLLTMRFTSNPAGYGADDYAAIVGHLFTSESELQPILLSKYPKAADVVSYIASKTATETEAKEFRRMFARASEKVADSHRISSATQARYLNFTTEKDKEYITMVGVLGIIEPQFRSCFNAFFQEESQLPGLAQKIKSKKPSADDAKQIRLIQRDIETGLELLVDIKEKEFAEMKNEDAAKKNPAALELAILKGEKTVGVMVVGEERKQKISTIIGLNPAKMTPLEKLKAVDNVEKLIFVQAIHLINEAMKWLQARTKTLGNTLNKNPNNIKAAKKYSLVSEAHTLIEGNNPMFLRSPNPGVNGESQFSPISEVRENGAVKQTRIVQFQSHAKKHKDVLANKAISALTTFIEAISNFPTVNVNIDVMSDVSQFGIKRSESSPNLNTPTPRLDRMGEKARSQSSPNLNTPKRSPSHSTLLKLSKMSSAWFQRKCVTGTITAEGVTPIVPRSIRGPGSTPGAPAG
jgi:hypothetical protein